MREKRASLPRQLPSGQPKASEGEQECPKVEGVRCSDCVPTVERTARRWDHRRYVMTDHGCRSGSALRDLAREGLLAAAGELLGMS